MYRCQYPLGLILKNTRSQSTLCVNTYTQVALEWADWTTLCEHAWSHTIATVCVHHRCSSRQYVYTTFLHTHKKWNRLHNWELDMTGFNVHNIQEDSNTHSPYSTSLVREVLLIMSIDYSIP